MNPKIDRKSRKNDSKANAETRYQKKRVSRSSKTLEIMLSLKRGAIFHNIAVFKKLSNIIQQSSQQSLQNPPKSLQKTIHKKLDRFRDRLLNGLNSQAPP